MLNLKLENIFNEVESYANSYKSIDTENQNMKREIKVLTTKNQNLTSENKKLKDRIEAILRQIKTFFRTLLQLGNERVKDETATEIKDYYKHNEFDATDVYDISKETTKEDELFDYAGIPEYYKTTNKHKDNNKKKNDFDMSL